MLREYAMPRNPDSPKKGLDFAQKFKACEMLRNKAEVIMKERPLLTELSEMLSKDLGFFVSPRYLPELCETIGLTWEKRIETGYGGKRRLDELEDILTSALKDAIVRIENLEEHVLALGNQNRNLASENSRLLGEMTSMKDAVRQLYRDLGVVPHPSYGFPLDTSKTNVINHQKLEKR
jgi:hypothetical protein